VTQRQASEIAVYQQRTVRVLCPGSDLKAQTHAWCRLEVWDRDRSPRAYWSIGRAYFQESVYEKQIQGKKCPFNGPNYQSMRNFLFAASISQQKKLRNFGVVVLSPEKTSSKLMKQIEVFQNTIIQPQFCDQIQLLTYERLIDHLKQTGDATACKPNRVSVKSY
jgi:hypothetical protein